MNSSPGLWVFSVSELFYLGILFWACLLFCLACCLTFLTLRCLSRAFAFLVFFYLFGPLFLFFYVNKSNLYLKKKKKKTKHEWLACVFV